MSDELLAAVRKACSPRVWSIGVTLARGQRVTLEKEAGPELTLRVAAPQQPVPQVVLLNTEDLEWSCDCPSREDPCHHVVAAAIAWSESRKNPSALAASARKKLVLSYALTRTPQGVAVERALVDPSGAGEPVRVEALARAIEARQADTDLEVDDQDHKIERLLDSAPRGKLTVELLRDLVALLAGHPRVTLDGAKVNVDRAPLLPRARVFDDGPAIVFSVEADPTLEEVVAPQLGRAAGALRPLGEVGLAGPSWQNLPQRRRFERREWAKLVAEVIPLMEPRLAIGLESPRLPPLAAASKPRIDLGLAFQRDGVSVSPRLVYGDPPQVVIEQGQPIYLEGAVPRRDQAAEQALLTELRDDLNLVPGRRVTYSGNDAQRFLEKLKAQDAFDDLDEGPPLSARVSMDGDRFEVVFERTGDGGAAVHADARAVVEAWLGGFSLVPLLEGGFAPLPLDWLETHGPRLMALLSARDPQGELPPALLPDLAALADSLDAPPPPALEKLKPLLDDFRELPPAKLPADLTAELRRYQEAGVRWLSFMKSAGLGAVLADDMGLGKTLQTICVLDGRCLVVCPTSVLDNWARELARFRPGLAVARYHGPSRVLDPKAQVVVTTYGVLRLDLDALTAVEWDVAVLDEAQAIKNPESQTAQAAFALRARFRVSLSGTPLENKLEELWSQLHFTNPGLLGGRKDFDSRYAKPIADGHAGRAAELRKRIKPFVLRRMKEEVAPELPPRTEMVLHAELTESERTVYEAVHAATREEVLEKLAGGGSILGVLEALLRLRQAACHSALVPGQHAETSSKLEALVEALSQVVDEGHKALVFSQWTSFLDLTEKDLEKAGLGFVRLDGSTVDRAGVISRFQAPDGPPIFLISLKAGGTGLNLTEADHVFFLDPWWNPAVEQQAADRAHRIGQTRPVFIYRVVAKDTLEERILELQDRKRQLARVALGETDQAEGLTREDLLDLVR